jgi:hypothetical protein
MAVSTVRVDSTQAVTAARAHGLSSVTRGPGARPGTRLRRIGRIREKKVRDADQVRHDVVAVEAHPRQELVEHDQVLRDDGEQQRLEPGPRVRAGEQEREDPVEVDPAEVGAQPPAPPEAVGVGDVGEHHRPDEVDADADGARLGASAPARGGVAALVEGQRGVREDDEHEREQGLCDHVREPPADAAVDGEQPHVEGRQAREDPRDDGRDEEPLQQSRDRADGARAHHADAESQRQQRIDAFERGHRAVRAGDHAQRVELLLEDVARLLGPDAQFEPRTRRSSAISSSERPGTACSAMTKSSRDSCTTCPSSGARSAAARAARSLRRARAARTPGNRRKASSHGPSGRRVAGERGGAGIG